ncbi:MAG: primosomal protein N' [bacterium]
MPTNKYVDLAINKPLRQLFTYSVPRHLKETIAIGKRVIAPFKNKKIIGYVIGIKDKPEVEPSVKIREIASIIDQEPIINQELLKLTRWISNYYLCSWGEVINAALPRGLDVDSEKEVDKVQSKKVKIIKLTSQALVDSSNKQQTINDGERIRISKKGEEILMLLNEHGGSMFYKDVKVSSSVLRTLEKKGLVSFEYKVQYRCPFKDINKAFSNKHILTIEQEKVFEALIRYINTETYEGVLLHGITGSGKTEIYMQVVEEILRKKKEVVVLVPEISLTPQLVGRFRARFGERIAVLHSQLSVGERRDEWLRIKSGEVDIVLGARSAIFAPCKNLGLIIVDEEHESSYKQESSPRYNARDVAVMRAKFGNHLVLLGSATPSLESFFNAQIGKFKLLTLPNRPTAHSLPKVKVIRINFSNIEIISPFLLCKLKDRFDKREQSLLLLNRRGFASFIFCPHCDFVFCCDRCDVSLTYHSSTHKMICHYCGYTNAPPDKCPKCKREIIEYKGIGIQRLEQEVARLFPEARIQRMDRDTTKKKDSQYRIIKDMESGNIDILIGTQMIAKGLDLPNVSLVGVLGADLSLHFPDFRAGEKTFQLLTQVAGRAGRGDFLGEVIVQSFFLNHHSLKYVQHHDYTGFYKQESLIRKRLGFPPYIKLVNITLSTTKRDLSEERMEEMIDTVREIINKEVKKMASVEMLGPAVAPIARIKNKNRWQVILKSNNFSQLHQVAESVRNKLINAKRYHLEVSLDVDPINLL